MALRTDYEYEAKVMEVLDGDTLRLEYVTVDKGFGVHETHTVDTRVLGIDIWEDAHKDPAHKAKGVLARERVEQLCPLTSKVRVRTTLIKSRIDSDRDKKEKMSFTRVEGDVFIRITKELSDAGFAHNYSCPGAPKATGLGWCRLADVLIKEGHEKR